MRYILFFILFSVVLASCKKVADTPAEEYEGQNNPYCNDPEAINYNHSFPGTPNNAICIYPTDPFTGTYALDDTIYTADFASFYTVRDTITVYSLSKTSMAIVGFCGPYDSLKLTAGRYYRASLDSTTTLGQFLCNSRDTISGTLRSDSIGLKVDFVLLSDTAGTKFFKGTAIKIQ